MRRGFLLGFVLPRGFYRRNIVSSSLRFLLSLFQPLFSFFSLSLSIFFSLLLAENTTPHSNTSELEAASWSKEMNVNPSSAVDLDHLAWNLALTLYFHIVWIICLFDPHFLATAEKPSFLIFGSLPITNRTEQSNLCCPQTLSEMHTCVLALNFRIIC